MTLDNLSPIVVPPSEEKVFPNYWISKLIIEMPDENNGKLFIQLDPYNDLSGEILSRPEYIIISDFWQKYDEIPEVKSAIQSLIEAVKKIKN